MDPAARHTFFATCAPGLEAVLHEELRALRMARVERQNAGVHFEGRIEDAWRANLWLRSAVRVLWRLARFQAADESELYAGCAAFDWCRLLRPGHTFAVSAHARESSLEHTLFVAQRVKDAVVDQLRARTGARPDVDREQPDLRVHVHLFRDRCTLLADTSGESLHKRGWRRFQGRAPLAETLAAAMLQLSGWDRRSPLLDPFCGSGTLLVEGAWLASGRAPGLLRERYAFEELPGFDARAWSALREEARAAAHTPRKLILRGSDADARVLEGAAANLEAAGVAQLVQLEEARAEDFDPRPGWNAFVLTNPPYGERIGDKSELAGVYQAFGRRLRERCAGYRLALLAGDGALARELGIAVRESLPLRNGALDCRLLLAELPRR